MKSHCCNSELVNFNSEYNECFVCGKLERKMEDKELEKILEKYYFTNSYTQQQLIDEIKEYSNIEKLQYAIKQIREFSDFGIESINIKISELENELAVCIKKRGV